MQQQTYRFPNVVNGDTQNSVDFEILINGFPLDLTGFTIKLNWVSKSGAVLKSLSTENSLITITDAENGLFTVESYNVSLSPTDYVSDMEFTSPDNVIKTYIKVYMSVLKDYTT
jgi:hypothetical protein